MLPSINGKSLMECTADDLTELLDNESYRESDNVDYKKAFSVFNIPKENGNELNKARAEFRKDICAMANAQGGYLVYGIKEDGKGVPREIVGIPIKNNNTDQFENDVRNILQTVSPKLPHYELRFIPYNTNYVVIIYVYRDFYTPYVFLENNQDYRIYKRVGNAVVVASYSELRTMFTQSLSMEKEIYNYRMERIRFFQQQEDTPDHSYSQFVLLHIIPDTFLDSSYNKNLFLLQRKSQIKIDDLFSGLYAISRMVPSVDGLRFTSNYNHDEGHLFNNGIAEALVTLNDLINGLDRYPKGRLANISLWEVIESTINKYIQRMQFLNTPRLYVGISIIGCKNVITEDVFPDSQRGTIDRDYVICDPISIEDFTNEEITSGAINRLHIDYLLSLGIRYQEDLRKLIDQVQL